MNPAGMNLFLDRPAIFPIIFGKTGTRGRFFSNDMLNSMSAAFGAAKGVTKISLRPRYYDTGQQARSQYKKTGILKFSKRIPPPNLQSMDDKNQTNGGQNRQSRPRSGNGGNRNNNRNRNRNRNRNNNNRNYDGNRNSNNRNRNRGGRGRRPAQPPKRTLGQKILAILTFGILGKPTRKKRYNSSKAKPQQQRKPQPVQASKPHSQGSRKMTLNEVTSGRLYVGNLDYAANEDDLETLFSGVGTVVSTEVVTNPRTQQSKGFAFVEMNNIEAAKRAVDVLHDQDFMGRMLLVSGAKSEGAHDNESDEATSDSEEAA